MAHLREVAGAMVFGAALTGFVGGEYVAATIACVVLLAISVVAARQQSRSRRSLRDNVDLDMTMAFAVAWFMILVLPAHQFSHRATSVSVSVPGLEALWEVTYFSGSAALAIIAVRSLTNPGTTYLPLPLFGLPVFAFISGFWSMTSAYSLGRGMQMVASAVLAWGTIVLGLHDRRFVAEVARKVSRWLVWSAAGMAVAGLTVGATYAGASAANLETRFAWPGAHPNSVGFVTGLALIVLVASPRDWIRIPMAWRVGLCGLIGYAHYAAHARTALIALLAAGAYLFVSTAMRSRMARYVGSPYVVLTGVIGALVFRSQLLDYFYRGQDESQVTAGNGRMSLWGDALRLLETPFDKLFGLGFAASRSVFVTPEKLWATNAHSSILGVFVNLGAIGLTLLVVWLGYCLMNLLRSRLYRDPAGNTWVTLFVFCFVHGFAAETYSYPGTANAVMLLAAVWGAVIVRGSTKEGLVGRSPPDDARINDGGPPPGAGRPGHRSPPNRATA